MQPQAYNIMHKVLHAADWSVGVIDLLAAKNLVEKFHYAKGASNTATYLHGLFDSCGHLHGIAWWIPPTKSAAMATYPEWKRVLCLSRLVITPDTPRNACTFLLSRSSKAIPIERWPCLVTYADQWQGHIGTIYKADNWDYVGLTKPERVYVVGDLMKARK